MKSTTAIAAALMTITLSSSAGADGFKSMARELSASARRAGVERVAVMPFEPGDGSSAAGGWTISERFVTHLVRSGKVQAVERSMLKQLMKEHSLGRSGALEPGALKKLGRIFSADGIVTGSFVTLGSEVVVHARLIHLESGLILAACERKMRKDWFDAEEPIFVPAPEFLAQVPRLQDMPEMPEMRDSVSDDPCAGAPEKVDGLERQVLDLKARFWALKLKRGLDPRSLKTNPGSTISDPELKREFYDRLKEWHGRDRIPELTPLEVKRLVTLDGRAYSLYQQCGI